MTDCTNCGLSSLPGQKFCAECGTALERDSVPGAVSVSGELPTQKQSESANPACADCRTPVEDGSHYCFECGAAVKKVPAVSNFEPMAAAESSEGSTDSDAAAGFLAALWGGSASCGCGCFSLVIFLGLLVVLGAFL